MDNNNFELNKLYYYSDMDNYEFTAANRSYFESLGAVTWDDCFELAKQVFPTLPEKTRPYERKDPLKPEVIEIAPTVISKQYFEISGEHYKKLKELAERSGKGLTETLNLLIDAASKK